MFRTIMPFWLIGLLSCCWLSVFLAAQGLPWHFDEQRYYEDYHALSAEVETPHLSWAKESVWSDLKVLIIAPSWGQRESVELQQRYDFQVSTLMTLRHNAFAGLTSVGSPLSPEQVFAQFESELLPKKYDVIVVSRTSWGLFPSAYRYEILRKVYEEGSGLLLINVGKHQELDQLWKREAWQPEIELEELSALSYVNRGNAAKTNISGRIFGKGRVLRLDWRGMSAQMILTPWPAKNNFDLEWEYEHYLALCSKAILACADKINDSLEKPVAALQLQSGLREQQLSFEIKPGANGASLELLAFSKELPQGHQLGKFAYDQRKLGGIVNANLPAGAYVLLALSRNKQEKLCGYQYFPLQVQSNLYITDIKLEKEALAKAGDFVYDLRNGLELGQLTERQLTMRGGEVQIFALLDEKLPQTKIELLPKEESDPDFRLLCNSGKQSNAYHLRVFDAAGNERAEYADTVLNNEVYTLRPALNDPRGT